MAKAEFYEIVIKNKKDETILTNISLSDSIKKYLKDNSDTDNFCQKGNCAIILNGYLAEDENNTTFDFSKLTNKTIMSTLISEPSKNEDTFKEYNKQKLAMAIYTKPEKSKIKSIISETSEDELINALKRISIDKFKIYKIILDFNLLEKKLLTIFENKIMKRLNKDSIYFNITEKFKDSNHKLLTYQSLYDGLSPFHY